MLSEISASDDLEYDQYKYNKAMLLETTHSLLDNGIQFMDSLIYDEFNNVVKLEMYQILNGAWTYVAYIDYTYDENGNCLTRSNYNSFGNSTFTLGGVYNYYYDGDNKKTHWEMYMNGTDLMQQGVLTYDADDKIILEVGQDIFNSGTMEDSWKIDYQYNSDGTLKTAAQSFWDVSSWYPAGTNLFYYDEHKNCIKWDHQDGNVVTDRKEYEYNFEHTTDQIITPLSPEGGNEDLVARNNMVTTQHWYTENDAGYLVYVCDYFYRYDTLYNTGIANNVFDIADIRVYPNPSSDEIHVVGNNARINRIDVIDNAGKIILNSSGLNRSESKVDITTLNPGVYYIRLATSKGVVAEKLLVQ